MHDGTAGNVSVHNASTGATALLLLLLLLLLLDKKIISGVSLRTNC